MTALQKALVSAAIGLAAGTAIHQTNQAWNLRAQLRDLEQQQAPLAEQVEHLTRERDDISRQLAALREDHDRLKDNAAEVLKLRGEVGGLRRRLASLDAIQAPGARAVDPQPDRPAGDLDPPEADRIQLFVANADAMVAPGSTLAFGGWSTSAGKRTLVFVHPTVLEPSAPGRLGSVLLESQIVEIPDVVLDQFARELGLNSLKHLRTDAKASSASGLFTAEQQALLFTKLNEMPDVTLLSAPRIQTGDGVQAVLSVTEQKAIDGQEHALGPTLDVEPRIGADGSSVKLTVVARLKKSASTEP